MSHDVSIIVVGAGVIGLAIARELAIAGNEVLVLERHALFGSETSSRHSEVIHAGIYYPKHSLKAMLCTRGKALLYSYCESHGIGHKRLGKIIVATSKEQISVLDQIRQRATSNGVNDLKHLSGADVKALEPALTAYAGLLSPSTGIIDSHGFMLSLLGEVEAQGGMIAYKSSVSKIEPYTNGFRVSVSGDDAMQLNCKSIINVAGHGACALAHATTGLNKEWIPKAQFAKGNYFRLKGKSPVSRLIYPVPEPGGLGVHITLDQAGHARFGPDVQNIDSLNYDVDPARSLHFYEAIKRYWPDLQDDALVPDYAGIRPKIAFADKACNDFVIQGQEVHGINGLVNLFGIESPGLTSSLAIAQVVSNTIALQSN